MVGNLMCVSAVLGNILAPRGVPVREVRDGKKRAKARGRSRRGTDRQEAGRARIASNRKTIQEGGCVWRMEERKEGGALEIVRPRPCR